MWSSKLIRAGTHTQTHTNTPHTTHIFILYVYHTLREQRISHQSPPHKAHRAYPIGVCAHITKFWNGANSILNDPYLQPFNGHETQTSSFSALDLRRVSIYIVYTIYTLLIHMLYARIFAYTCKRRKKKQHRYKSVYYKMHRIIPTSMARVK